MEELRKLKEDDPDLEWFVRDWCTQTALFAMMVRADDLDKSIPSTYNKNIFKDAQEVCQKVTTQAGPIESFQNNPKWMIVVADKMFSWLQDHLEM